MIDVQDRIDGTSSYKKLTLEKVLCKKRGRACNRREKKGTPETRIIRDALAASFSQREYDKASRGSDKQEGTNTTSVSELRAIAQMHQANFETGLMMREVMSKFPPLT